MRLKVSEVSESVAITKFNLKNKKSTCSMPRYFFHLMCKQRLITFFIISFQIFFIISRFENICHILHIMQYLPNYKKTLTLYYALCRHVNFVCGNDGQTYTNPCMADCRNVSAVCQGPCPCESTPSPSGK